MQNIQIQCIFDTENITFEEAIRSEKWKEAMDEEINAIERNKTLEMAQLPKGQKPIGVKWVYKKKMNVEGEVHRAHEILPGFRSKARDFWDFISQTAYAKEILKKSKMENSNPVVTPMELCTKFSKIEGGEPMDANLYRSLVGSLRYLTCTRPDLSYSVGVVSRFMENPKYAQLKALKRIMRYVKGTESLRLFYSSSKEYKLKGYSNSDWHGDVDDRKSTSGYVFFMGETAFTWASKKQPIVALSTCEAEYVAASWTVCHAIWLRNLLRELKNEQDDLTEIKVDNKSTIELARNPAADIFTEALPTELFNLCKQKIGMKDARDVSLREEFVRK
ncbi:retrovirus-related pol polyprotein from transposon TNT 1-94 [Tanacetum coccineum]